LNDGLNAIRIIRVCWVNQLSIPLGFAAYVGYIVSLFKGARGGGSATDGATVLRPGSSADGQQSRFRYVRAEVGRSATSSFAYADE
jgi:hypothetical protein